MCTYIYCIILYYIYIGLYRFNTYTLVEKEKKILNPHSNTYKHSNLFTALEFFKLLLYIYYTYIYKYLTFDLSCTL